MTSWHFLLSKVESIVLSEEGYKGRSFEGDRKSQGKKIPARRRMLTCHYFFRPLGFLFGFREEQNTNKCSLTPVTKLSSLTILIEFKAAPRQIKL